MGTATHSGAAAVLLATHADAAGTPAAVQVIDDGTVLGRLVAQLGSLGVDQVTVVARPDGAAAVRAAASAVDAAAGATVEVVESADLAADLGVLAATAGTCQSPLVVAAADVVLHREALAGLLADPRIASGIVTTSARPNAAVSFHVRALRGRLVSAASPFHKVTRPTGYFLDILKVDVKDLPTLVSVATELAALAQDPPTAWLEEYDRKVVLWQSQAGRASFAAEGLVGWPTGESSPVRWKPFSLGEANEPVELRSQVDGLLEEHTRVAVERARADVSQRVRMSQTNVAALVLTGLVRAGVPMSNSYLRQLFWARPTGPDALDQSLTSLAQVDEDAVLLASAVKANDGFFTTFFVSPYSRYIARWSARVGLTPNIVTTMSMLVGILAALAFAVGNRAGLVAGALLLQAAFTLDCVDGQLARYSRQFSKLGAWLDSVFDRGKEYVVYAGLAFGAARSGEQLWVLAAAALTLQTVRHLMDFSYSASQHQVIESLTQLPLESPEDRPVSVGRLLLDEPRSSLDESALNGAPVPAAAASSRRPVAERPAAELEVEGSEPLPEESLVVAEVVTPRQRVRVLGRRIIRFWHSLDKLPGLLWTKRIILLPIGERFALISVVAAFFSARAALLAVLSWGCFALFYGLVGRSLRSVAR